MITYIATNTRNGKFYIGSTTHFERRQKEHLTTAQEFHFQRALRRNPELFIWEIYEDDSEEPILEQALLDVWFGKEQCYNMCAFAGRPPARKGAKLTPEQYEKLVNRLRSNHPGTGKSRSQETKDKISQKLKGTKMPIEIKKKISRTLRGKKKSPEHCAAISKGRREKVKPKDSKILRWLPEIQAWIDSGLSYRAIAKILGVSHSTVSRLLTTTPT
jgi:group I intron endonuclease